MLEADTLNALKRFAHQVRHPYPSSSEPGLAVYQRLFINNVRSMLASSFPVCFKLLTGPAWTQLTAAFYAQHLAKTPRFTELATEFIEFVARPDGALNLPYPVDAIAELLHYEWVETELMLAEADTPATPEGALRLSPLARALAYRYPVHTLSAMQPPGSQAPAVPTFLLLWRSEDFSVRFQQLTPPAMQLLLSFQEPSPIPSSESTDAAALLQRWQCDGVLI